MNPKNRNSKFSFSLIILLGAFCVCLFFAACADEASSASKLDKSFGGFVRISSKGKSVLLEAADLRANFTYNFYIAEHEVTRAEYSELSGSDVPEGEGELPMTGVSWYDAVLYANALSKKFRLDTVYAYTGRTFDSEGRAIFLENLSVDYARDGYRLPTEAEWTFAAGDGWNPSAKGWTAENSEYEPHPVCSLERDGSGLCDMAGNVAEWTGDWMSDVSDTTVSDFVGGAGPNALNEVILKGGSFRNAAENISLKNRKDIYTVTPSMSADYVGFRLVRGEVAAPGAVENGRDTASAIHVRISLSPKEIRKKLGTYQATLAFRDDETGNIGFVNFYGSNPRAVEIPDTVDSYHPAISPDGKRVAFCTKPEGVSGKSELYVRNLDANGSGLARLDVESAAVPRWRVVGADTQIVYVTSAGNNSDASDWKSGSTWAVGFSDGKFGEPVKLFDGTYNGGVSADGKLAVTGARFLRANVGGREEVWYGGDQACNASLEDSTGRTLFLDFGGAAGTSFAGRSYLAHEMLLVADGAGKLSEMVPSPSGRAFDHTEWVRGKPGLAVSSLTDAGGSHSSLALVDTRDSSVTVLAEGAELWHPDLWVGKSDAAHFELDPDSAGVYYSSAGTLGDYVMRIKMELLWRYKDSANVVVLGSSRPLNAVSAEDFSERFFVLNLAQTPNSMYLSREILEKYVYPHVSGLKYLILSLDIDFWWKTEEMEDASLAVYQRQYPGYAYDKNHGYWKADYPSDLLKLTENGPGNRNEDSTLYSVYARNHGRAFMGCVSWGGDEPQISIDSAFYDNKPELIKNNFAVLRSILESTASKNVHVVGVIFPQSPAYKSTGAFGRYGLRRSKAKVLLDSLKGLETEYANFSLMDENKFGDHDYGDDVAMDYDHLCHRGAVKISVRLDSLLRTLEDK